MDVRFHPGHEEYYYFIIVRIESKTGLFFFLPLNILFVTVKKLDCRKNNLTQKAGGEITGNYRLVIAGSSPTPWEIAAPPALKNIT
jgi:hypothetical protein